MEALELEFHPPDIGLRADGSFSFPLSLKLEGEEIKGHQLIIVRSSSHSHPVVTASIHLGRLPPSAVDYGVKADNQSHEISIRELVRLKRSESSATTSAPIQPRPLSK